MAEDETRQGEMKKRDDLSLTIMTARLKAGLTQAELAERMRTHRSMVTRWETGVNVPTVTTLERIAEVTGRRLVIRLS